MRYKVGMYGGTFNPLHLGHVSCILQAANMCEELYIVLSVGENRKEIDPLVRYRWLYRLTHHIGNVKILFLKDTLPTKEAYAASAWMEDCAYVKRQIGKPIDVVFCGSDYGEDSFWNVGYPESEWYVFERDHISSTKIRENPYTHWDMLPRVVRPYYVKKVLLIGGESTGKSTLTINLAHYYNTNYVDEAGRELSERSGTDRLMLTEDFSEILLQQKLNEIKAVEHSNKVLFIDTDALITRFYMHFLEDPGMDKNVALSDAIDAINAYDLILFLEPDVAFVQDGDRSEMIRDNRQKYSDAIKAIFDAHGKPYVVINGDYQDRFTKAVAEIDAILNEKGE